MTDDMARWPSTRVKPTQFAIQTSRLFRLILSHFSIEPMTCNTVSAATDCDYTALEAVCRPQIGSLIDAYGILLRRRDSAKQKSDASQDKR